jgi:thioredoxin-dependent peroxiredoxin
VFGVSMDDEASHQAFTDKFSLPFPLLADTDGAVTKAFGVAGEKNGFSYAQRVTFVITNGSIAQVFDTINTETHATDVMAAIG